MAATHLAYPDLALDKFSGTDPDQDAESFIQLIERKINFALGDAPANPDALANYNFRKKALFSSLLRGPAAEWYGSTIEAATPWEDIRTNFITRFSDGRNKFRHRLEVEHCVRRDGEEIRNFFHRIKKTVDKGWLDDMNGIARAQQNAERDAQARQRRQRYMDYSLRGLRPRYLQRKAQEYLMEHPNATWNDFSTHIIQKDVSFQVSSNFLNDEEQTKAELASLGQEMKSLRTELQEHRINAVEGTPKPVDPNQKGRQNATRFCNYCRTNGHTPSWCRKKIRDEELKKIENERTAEKRVTFTQDYNKKRGPSHGSGQLNNNQNFSYRNNSYYGQDNQNRGRLVDRGSDQFPDRYDGNRLNNGNFSNQSEAWRNNGNFSRSPSGHGRDFSQGNSFRRLQPFQPRNSPFRRSDGNPTNSSSSYEQKFPQNDNQTSTNVVRFTTTDDYIIELSELCPLNC